MADGTATATAPGLVRRQHAMPTARSPTWTSLTKVRRPLPSLPADTQYRGDDPMDGNRGRQLDTDFGM